MKPSNIIEAIQDAKKAKRALWLWGPPGVGKTAIVAAAAELLGVRLSVTRVVEHEPVDYGGFPIPDREGRFVNRLVERWLPQDGTEGILFLDELAQATVETQCAAMRVVDNIPDGWQVIAASNRITDRAGARQSPTHVLDRFTHLEFDVVRDDWHKWAVANGVHHIVCGFLDFRPALLWQFDPSKAQTERTSCNPRSWVAVSDILKNCREDLQSEMISGTIGVGPANELMGYIQIANQLPHPDTILRNPESAPLPTKPDAQYAVCAALTDRMRTLKPHERRPVVQYLVRLPLEFAALGLTDIMGVVNTIEGGPGNLLTFPEAGAWISQHQSVFAQVRK